MPTRYPASVASNWNAYSTDKTEPHGLPADEAMSKLTITQVHSQIKCPKRQKDTLKALGLGRIGKIAVVEGTPQIRGMVAKVNHLVSVKEA